MYFYKFRKAYAHAPWLQMKQVLILRSMLDQHDGGYQVLFSNATESKVDRESDVTLICSSRKNGLFNEEVRFWGFS